MLCEGFENLLSFIRFPCPCCFYVDRISKIDQYISYPMYTTHCQWNFVTVFPKAGVEGKQNLKNLRIFFCVFKNVPITTCNHLRALNNLKTNSGVKSFASPVLPVIWNGTFISIRASVMWVLHLSLIHI